MDFLILIARRTKEMVLQEIKRNSNAITMENLIKITKDKTMLTVIRTNGEITELKPKGRRISLEEMQKVVGGYIEMVTLKKQSSYL
jgi:hypothetical protein